MTPKTRWALLGITTSALLVTATVFALTANAEGETLTARAGEDFTVECTSPSGALVALDGSGSTPAENDTIATYEWLENGQVIATNATAQVQLGLGTHAITLRISNATGGENGTATDNVTVVVRDTTAPALTATPVGNATVWPPNHKTRNVQVAVSVSDACTASPTHTLVSATSDEPDDGRGDGHTTGDLTGADVGTSDTSFTLRAERAGPGDGRDYAFVYEARDASGNVARATAVFHVPHGD